jgi:glycosyltransferase involved in cell wall biosynthesis
VSIVVIAKNERENISRCLDSMRSYSDVVVIDDYSEDQTAQLAESHGARVLQHTFESFAKQRNWALEHADLKHDWVLFLDADEVLTPEFNDALRASINSATNDVAAFSICRKTMFLGKWLRYSDGFPVWIMRVVRRGRASFVDSGHGEVPVPPVDGTLVAISAPFIHYPFSKGLTDWFARHNRYSTREAELEFANLPPFRSRDLVTTNASVRRRALRNLGRRLPGRPLFRFAYQFIFRGGFLDGHAGLAFSTLMASYEAMIVVKKLELTYRDSELATRVRANSDPRES